MVARLMSYDGWNRLEEEVNDYGEAITKWITEECPDPKQ